MFVVCAWCKPPKIIGSKPPYEDKSETHTICHDCYAEYLKKADRGRKEQCREK